jgi:hypothetical protein
MRINKPSFKIDPDWEMVSVKDVFTIKPPKSELRGLNSDLKVTIPLR